MIIEREELATLIPHRGRMSFITRVKDYDLEAWNLCAECEVGRNDLFYDPALDAVPAWVGFEFIAQAISALTGLWLRENNKEPKIGFILSVSSMRIDIPSFKAGSIPEVTVRKTGVIDVIHSFEGEIYLEGKKVMEGKLTVMDAKDEQIEAFKKGILLK